MACILQLTQNMATMNTDNEFVTHPWERLALGKAPFQVIGFEVSIFRAVPEAPAQPGTSCDACGTGIMNVYKIKSADGRTFKVGCDCVTKTHDRKLVSEVKAIQREARAKASATRAAARAAGYESRKAQRVADFRAAHPDVATALDTCEHPIVKDIAAGLNKCGSLSAKQIALVLRLAGEVATAEQAPAEPAAVPVPAAYKTGRVEIVGTILGTKAVDSMYGTQLKMLIRVPAAGGAWKAWSTVPAALERPADGWHGAPVTLVARVEVSKDDPCFAFLNRPSVKKAK